MIKAYNNRMFKNIMKSLKCKPPLPPPPTEQTFYCWFGTIKNDKKSIKKVSNSVWTLLSHVSYHDIQDLNIFLNK